MKKLIASILLIATLAVLLVPIPLGTAKDGGTNSYISLTYKVVKWKKFTDSYRPYENTTIYFFPYNFYSLDALWEKETEKFNAGEYGDVTITATVMDVWGENSFLIKSDGSNNPNGDIVISNYDNPNVFKNENTASFSELKVGDKIKIIYDGIVMETYPATLGKVYEIEILE